MGELAATFEMSPPAISKHLKMQRAGLILRDVDGQRRPARLNAALVAEAMGWITGFREFWDGSFDQLDGLLADLHSKGDQR